MTTIAPDSTYTDPVSSRELARATWHALRRFLRTPKGLMLLGLCLLAALAAPGAGFGRVLPDLLLATTGAVLVDALFLRLSHGAWRAPSGALLTGLFVALILDPHEAWHVVLFTTVLAITAKWLARSRGANVFNPAAAALVTSGLLYGSGQSWWGALPDLPLPFIGVLLALLIFIAGRLNKLPMAVVFLGVYFALFTVAAFTGDPARVAEIFRAPTLNAALFFAGFMLTDPPTSPVRYRDQLLYAAIVASASTGVYLTLGAVYFLPAGLLVGNVWEAGRRLAGAHRRQRRTPPPQLTPPAA